MYYNVECRNYMNMKPNKQVTNMLLLLYEKKFWLTGRCYSYLIHFLSPEILFIEIKMKEINNEREVNG